MAGCRALCGVCDASSWWSWCSRPSRSRWATARLTISSRPSVSRTRTSSSTSRPPSNASSTSFPSRAFVTSKAPVPFGLSPAFSVDSFPNHTAPPHTHHSASHVGQELRWLLGHVPGPVRLLRHSGPSRHLLGHGQPAARQPRQEVQHEGVRTGTLLFRTDTARHRHTRMPHTRILLTCVFRSG